MIYLAWVYGCYLLTTVCRRLQFGNIIHFSILQADTNFKWFNTGAAASLLPAAYERKAAPASDGFITVFVQSCK